MKALNWILNNVCPSAVFGFQVQVQRAMSGILKRKFEEVEASSSPCSSLRESDDEVSCSESGDSSDSVNPSASGPFTRECLCLLNSFRELSALLTVRIMS